MEINGVKWNGPNMTPPPTGGGNRQANPAPTQNTNLGTQGPAVERSGPAPNAGAGAPVNRGPESARNAQQTNTQGPGRAVGGGYGVGEKVNVTA